MLALSWRLLRGSRSMCAVDWLCRRFFAAASGVIFRRIRFGEDAGGDKEGKTGSEPFETGWLGSAGTPGPPERVGRRGGERTQLRT